MILALAISGCAARGEERDAGLRIDAVVPNRLDAALDASLEELDGGALVDDSGFSLIDGTDGAVRRPLVRPELWRQLGEADDPWTDRPDGGTCSRAGFMPEALGGEYVFSVDTGICHYLTAIQNTRSAVAAGESIKVRVYHFELSNPYPAEAHVAVVVDGITVLDERVPIPQPGGPLDATVRVARAIPQGAPVHFHVHNHGANSWALVEITAIP